MSMASKTLTAKELLNQSPDTELFYFEQAVLFAKEFAFGCVLDAGCGEGLVAQRIRHSPLVTRIILLDKNEEALRAAAQRLNDDRYAAFVTIRHDLTLALSNVTADTIICFGVLEALSEHTIPEVFKNFKKILIPKGRLLLQVPIDEIGANTYEQWLNDVGLSVHEERDVPVSRTSNVPYQHLWLVGHTQLTESVEYKQEKIRYFALPTVVPA